MLPCGFATATVDPPCSKGSNGCHATDSSTHFSCLWSCIGNDVLLRTSSCVAKSAHIFLRLKRDREARLSRRCARQISRVSCEHVPLSSTCSLMCALVCCMVLATIRASNCWHHHVFVIASITTPQARPKLLLENGCWRSFMIMPHLIVDFLNPFHKFFYL